MSVMNSNVEKYLRLISQPSVKCQLEIQILNDDETVLDTLDGVIECGSYNISSTSEIRRSCSITIVPTINQSTIVDEANYIWINKSAKLRLGITDLRTEEIVWFNMGYFVFTDVSNTFDAHTNSLSVTCNDFMVKLDGTRNGTLGQLKIDLPAYKEDPDTGEVLERYQIRDAIMYIVGQLGRVNKMMVENIGYYLGLESRNPEGYKEYREANPDWDAIPYDMSWGSGTTVLTMLKEVRDLYPNYESFFDIDNVFVCRMKPSCYDDDLALNAEQMERIILSDSTEQMSKSFSEVKNMSEMWGKVIEPDYYTDSGVTYSNNIYAVPNKGYFDHSKEASEQKYYNGDTIAIKIPADSSAAPQMYIYDTESSWKLEPIPIYDGENLHLLEAGILKKDNVYNFKIKRSYDVDTKKYTERAIYMGQYMPHGMTVLLNSDHHDETYTTNTGVVVEKYSPEYFYELYDVSPNALTRTINPDSPFAIEKIGEILQVADNKDLLTDDECRAWSNYNNYLSSRLTDNVTISTLLVPWLDVNMKIEYFSKCSGELNQYIIDSIAHDFSSGTSTITMHRYYPLYDWL